MKVVFTPEAERQVTEMDTWWREHRLGVRDLFTQELVEAGRLLAASPMVGTTYRTKGGTSVRRLLMPKTKNHLYYEVQDAGLVVVLAVWGAPRGRGPKL